MQMCADIRASSQVELASYIYDDPTVQALLLKRLRGQEPLKLNVYIDAEQFRGEVPRFQMPRLKALHTAGARVFICKGSGSQGAFHGKAVVVDKRYLYAGSANVTSKSHRNEEFCFRMTGDVVQQLLGRLQELRLKSKDWNGA